MKKIVLVVLIAMTFVACQSEYNGYESADIIWADLALAEPMRICPELESLVSMAVMTVDPPSVAAVTEFENEFDRVRWREFSYTLTGVIQNDSDWYIFGEPFHALEVYGSGQWWLLPLSNYVALQLGGGFDVYAHDFKTFNANLSIFPLFPIQGTQRYRIRKTVMAYYVRLDGYGNIEETRSPGTWHDLMAEFYWEK